MTPADPQTPLDPVDFYRFLIALVLTVIGNVIPFHFHPALEAIALLCSLAAITLWLLLYRALGGFVVAGVIGGALPLLNLLPNAKLAPMAERLADHIGVAPVVIVVAAMFVLSIPAVMTALIHRVRTRATRSAPNDESDDSVASEI